MAKEKKARRPKPTKPTGRKKVSMWLDLDALKILRHAAVAECIEQGAIVGAALRKKYPGAYWYDPSSKSAAPSTGPKIAVVDGSTEEREKVA